MSTLASCTTSLTPFGVDISGGKEPIAIRAEGVNADQLAHFHYVRDSFDQDGVIGSANQEDEASSDTEDGSSVSDMSSGSSDDADRTWACDCVASVDEELGWSCTRSAQNPCDCVAAFGNFYSTPRSNTVRQTLDLDALPPNLPLVECSTSCPCDQRCANRLTQGGIRIPLVVRTNRFGLGIYYDGASTTVLPRGAFICLYAGEYIDTAIARDRWAEAEQHPHPAGSGNYILSLRLPSETIHIDPRVHGNAGRFLNHSCDPNCVIQVVQWGPDARSRAAIFAKRTINAGEELTFDYGDASGHGKPRRSNKSRQGETDAGTSERETRCLCGSSSCRGYMPFDQYL